MTDVAFGASDFDLRTKKYKASHDLKKQVELAKTAFQIGDAQRAIGLDKLKDPSKLNDLTGLVPPLKINQAQKHFLDFWFGTSNSEKIIQNRQKIYLGQLNAQCPNFSDPLATQPYINYATQKLECRRPIPNRKITNNENLDCALYAQTGPNPFAIERYIKETGEAVCRVPVIRGKFFCSETSTTAPIDQRGEHVTLPDGTGICVPAPSTANPWLAPPQPSARTDPKYSMLYSRFFSDRVVHTSTPSEIEHSPYYTLFTKLRFNHAMVDTVNKAVRLSRKAGGGKHKLIEYLQSMKDPMGAAFKQTIDALYADPLPDALYRYHRDLYFYIKKNYPGYFNQGVVPQEDRMYFLGYEGEWAFDRKVVHV